MIGAGSLVPPGKRLESGYLYLGSPVRQIRPLNDNEKEGLHYSANNYVPDLPDRTTQIEIAALQSFTWRHQTSGTNHHLFFYYYAIKQNRSHSDQHAIANGTALYHWRSRAGRNGIDSA